MLCKKLTIHANKNLQFLLLFDPSLPIFGFSRLIALQFFHYSYQDTAFPIAMYEFVHFVSKILACIHDLHYNAVTIYDMECSLHSEADRWSV